MQIHNYIAVINQSVHEKMALIANSQATPQTLSMKNLNISCFENTVDPDQLASKKPANQDPHCFPLSL